MTYVICEPCKLSNEGACSRICPVDCIYTDEGSDQYFINPDECIDCGACEPVCPVSAIFPAQKVPDRWKTYIEVNSGHFG